jgi:solute carrier family 25, member 39/40
LARTVQTVLVNPIFVIKTRFEVIGFNDYNNTYDAIRKIYRAEGIGGFTTGLKVSLIRDVPFSGCFYPIYNFIKVRLFQMYERIYGSHNLTGGERLKVLAIISSIGSFSANIFSCTLTHPIDLIRTRVYF